MAQILGFITPFMIALIVLLSIAKCKDCKRKVTE